MRALRNVRVVSVALRLRRVVEGFITALPGMGSVFLLMSIISYIGGVIVSINAALDQAASFASASAFFASIMS